MAIIFSKVNVNAIHGITFFKNNKQNKQNKQQNKDDILKIIKEIGKLGIPVLTNIKNSYPHCIYFSSINPDYKRFLEKIESIRRNFTGRELIKSGVNDFIKGKMERVVCLIAVYGRTEIVKLNVAILKAQTIKVDIVLIVSTTRDEQIAKSLGVNYVWSINSPLGKKFQNGMEYCRIFNPKCVIINGSDDLFSLNYCNYIVNVLKNYNSDLVGVNLWYLYHKGTYYQTSYKTNRFIGCGRGISRRILDKINWEYYPINRPKGLDFYSKKRIMNVNGKIKIVLTPSEYVISYKGDWDMITEINRILKSPNFKIVRKNNRTHGIQKRMLPILKNMKNHLAVIKSMS